jgi:hypothetical protein
LKIPDPRNPKKIKHKLTMLMIYGILTFVLHMSSRREANRELTRPMFRENLKTFFPQLGEAAHHDTLTRVLDRIEVEQIEAAQIELVRDLIRKKKLQRYLIQGRYPISFDGTQKLVRDQLPSEQWLQRGVGNADAAGQKKQQYYVYVVEANLTLSNGMSIPVMSEFLEYSKGDVAEQKQDCERRGFYRLAQRLKQAFPRLPIIVCLDGLYPVGPVIERCRKYNWDMMIVLQDGSLAQVWEEYRLLKRLQTDEERLSMNWVNRRQRFDWVNNIEYRYDAHGKKKQMLHVVVCEESWEEVDSDSGKTVTRTARHVWISGEALNRDNVHTRCNLAARHRWGIESGFLVEKRRGYHYEHCFSYSWQAMRGYHYLMRIGHLLNELALHSTQLVKMVNELGVHGLICFIRGTLSGPWFDEARLRELVARPSYLRFA